MAELKKRIPLESYTLKSSVMEAAMEQIRLRLAAGEAEDALYAACWNEYAYLNDLQENPAHQEELVAMLFDLTYRIAQQHMEALGWEYNEKGRFVR
jgi:hypothetical protein